MRNKKRQIIKTVFVVALLIGAFYWIFNSYVDLNMPKISIPSLIKSNGEFFIPQEMNPNIRFWKGVFSDTSINSVIFYTPDEHLILKKIDINIDFSLDSDKELVNVSLYEEGIKIDSIALGDVVTGGIPDKALFSDKVTEKLDKIYDELDAKLHENGTLTENDHIGYTYGKKEKFENSYKYSGRYINKIKEIFAENGVPKEIAYLAFTESSFDPYARSASDAVGAYQMISGTARNYGLKVSKNYDERKDPLLEANAASKYLAKLYGEFDNWLFAINAYHSGEQNLRKALSWVEKYYPTKPDDFKGSLRDYQYVMVINKFPDDHEINNGTLRYGKASSQYTTLFFAFLESVKEFENGAKDQAVQIYPAKVKYSKDYKREKEVTVESGDTLIGIAYSNDVLLEDLKEVNSLSGNLIRPGQRLKLFIEEPPLTIENMIESLNLNSEEISFLYENNFSYREKNDSLDNFITKKIYSDSTINLPTEALKDKLYEMISNY